MTRVVSSRAHAVVLETPATDDCTKRSDSASAVGRIVKRLIAFMPLLLIIPEWRVSTRGLVAESLSVTGEGAVGGAPFVMEVAVIVAAVLSVADALMNPRGTASSTTSVRIVGLLAYWSLIASILAALAGVEQGASMPGNARMVVEGFLAYWVVTRWSWSVDEIRAVYRSFVIAALVQSLLILLAFKIGDSLPIETSVVDGGTPRYAGLFIQPSNAALLLGCGFILAAGTLLTRREGRLKQLFLGLVCLSLASGLLLTQTRSALLGVGVALLFLLLVWLRDATPTARVVGTGVLAVGLVALPIVLSGNQILTIGFGRFAEGTGRGDIFGFAFDYIGNNPLGGGVGGFAPAAGSLNYPHAHNTYLQWGVMFGIPASLLFISFLWSLFSSSFGIGSSVAKTGKDATVLLTGQAVLMVVTVASFAEVFLLSNAGLWIWVLFGLVTVTTRAVQEGEPHQPPLGGRSLSLAAAVQP